MVDEVGDGVRQVQPVDIRIKVWETQIRKAVLSNCHWAVEFVVRHVDVAITVLHKVNQAVLFSM